MPSERFMKKHYGASGYVEPAVAAQPEPEPELDRGDLLSMSHINSLPGPLFIRLAGDKEFSWPLEYIDVETGLIKFDVCGKLQSGHIGDVAQFRDSSGIVHDSETFYSDFIVEPAAQPVGELEQQCRHCCRTIRKEGQICYGDQPCVAVKVEPKPAPQETGEASKWKRRYEMYCSKKLPAKTWEEFLLSCLICAHDSLEHGDNISRSEVVHRAEEDVKAQPDVPTSEGAPFGYEAICGSQIAANPSGKPTERRFTDESAAYAGKRSDREPKPAPQATPDAKDNRLELLNQVSARIKRAWQDAYSESQSDLDEAQGMLVSVIHHPAWNASKAYYERQIADMEKRNG